MGFSFKMVSTQNLASLVWLESEHSLEWLLPLWAVPRLQSRGCLKPGARSRSYLRIICFPLKFSFFLSSSLSFIPSIQTTTTTYDCFLPSVSTAWLFLIAYISLHLLTWLLAFLTCSFFSFSSFAVPSCFSLLYKPSAHSKHYCFACNPPYWPWYQSLAPWILFISYSHSIAWNPHFIPLMMPWTISSAARFCVTILEFCCTKHWEIFHVCFCFDLLNRYKSRQEQHLFS